MNLEPQDDMSATVGGPFRRTRRPQPETFQQDDRALPPEGGGLAAVLLACAAPLAFCTGLIGLAASSAMQVPAPRWLILACGVGCVLPTLLAAWLTRPWLQPHHRRRLAAEPGTRRTNLSSRSPSSRPGTGPA
jgi:hypothetical protein